MGELIIEVVNRLGQVSERHKFHKLPVSVGRSYSNDLIIADQHVSPHHLLISENISGWKIDDHGSHNGMQVKHANSIQRADNMASIDIDSGDEIIIGKTRLRFYSPQHPVAETIMLPKQDAFSRHVGKPMVSASIVISCILIYILNHQLSSGKELSIEKLFAMSLPPLFMALIWGGIWAFVGRVLKHEANFSIQFSTSLLFVIGTLLISTAKEYTLYISSSFGVSLVLETLATGIILSTLLYINLENSSNTSVKTRLWTSQGIAWGILLGGMFLSYANKAEFRHSPSFPSVLKPPFAKLAPSQPFEEFLENSEDLFKTPVDKDKS